jgi:HNH endonuclease
MKKGIEEKFWSKVDLSKDCWVWKGFCDRDGYGKKFLRLTDGKLEQFAHRVSWIITHGCIPEGMCVLHRCDNPPCVRPDHLFIGSQNDNNKDMQAKGRQRHPGPTIPSSGDKHWTRKYPELIKQIAPKG